MTEPARFPDNTSKHEEVMPYGEHDLSLLRQFRTAVRIVKQVPIDPDRVPLSWYGGSPRMPEAWPWPMADGEPMVFIAQLHCADFPADLWGGVGPREGWLLVFLGPRYGGEGIPVKIIHTLELGPERDRGGASVEWLFLATREVLVGEGIVFPRWPVSFSQVETFKENVWRRSRTDWTWPGGRAGSPLTRSGLKAMLDSMIERQEVKCRQNEALITRLAKRISDFETPTDGTPEDRDPKGKQLAYNFAIRSLPEAQAARQINTTALAELAACQQRYPIEQLPELITDAQWMRIADDLSKIEYSVVKETVVVEPKPALCREVYKERRYDLERPETVEKLNAALTAIILENGALRHRLNDRVRYRIALIEQKKAMLSERERLAIELAEKTLDEARRVDAIAGDTARILLSLRERVAPSGASGALSDSAWAEVRSALNIVVWDFDWSEVLPRIEGISDYQIKTYGLLDLEGLRDDIGGWSRGFEYHRSYLASRLYAKDPRIVPVEARTHFERFWASAAAGERDGMGGLPPLYDNVVHYFDSAVYYSPSDQQKYREENPYWHLPAAPLNRDNAAVLYLCSDHIMGWMWGDVGSLLIIAPRAELAQGNFDNAVAVTGDKG